MRVLKVVTIAVIALAAGRTWAEEITYDYNTGDLSLVQDSTWAAQNVSGLYNFEVYMAGTNANNYAPDALDNYGSTGLPYIGPASNGNDWNCQSYYGAGLKNDIFWEAGSDTSGRNVGKDNMAVGTVFLAQLPAGLTAADFGSSVGGNYGANDTTGAAYFANYSGAETQANITLLNEPQSVPEPGTLAGLIAAAVSGLVGFVARRRKVAV